MSETPSETDPIEASRAPLISHLIELRQRLIWSILGIAIGFAVCFYFADSIFRILLWPAARAAGGYADLQMIYTSPPEYFFTKLKLALFGAIFLAFPVIASQIYMFVAPGLYQNERRAFVPYLIATPILFVLGAALLYFVVMPLAMSFFLAQAQGGPVDPATGKPLIHDLFKVSEYLSFIMLLILAFGLSFQMPVVLTLLAHAGFITSDTLRRKRKFAIVAVFAMAAVLTPPDIISQTGLAVPALALYELSIYAVKFVERQQAAKRKAEEDA